MDHMTYLKLKNNLLLLQAEQFHKVTTLLPQIILSESSCQLFWEFAQFVTTEILISLSLSANTNANPMKIFGQLASHPKLLIGSKLSLG